MSTDSRLLDALVQKGVLVNVSVRYWRARKKLNAEDLGLSRDQVDDSLISLGHKRLVPKESMQRLALLEGRAHALIEQNTFPFLNGIAHYLPNTKLEEVTGKLRAIQDDFEREQTEFLGAYAELRRTALDQWAEAADQLVDDPAVLLATIEQAFPPIDRMPRYFSFDISLFQISVPDVPQVELIDLGTQAEVMQARREATQAARSEINASCQAFVSECASALREQTSQLCSEMLQTIQSTGSVHQKTLNRLIRFIDHFRELNFVNDAEMESQLQIMRDEFLNRSAVSYRGNTTARMDLVSGLRDLREKAQELASEDAQELVQSFGQMGRRRFSLAA